MARRKRDTDGGTATADAPPQKGCYVFWLRQGQNQCRPQVKDPADGIRKRIQLVPGHEYPLPLTPVDFRRYTDDPASIYPGVAWRYDNDATPIVLREIEESQIAIHRATVRSPILSRVKARLSRELGPSAMVTLERQGGEPSLVRHYNSIVSDDEQVELPGLNPSLPAGVVKIGGDAEERVEAAEHVCKDCGYQASGAAALKGHRSGKHPKRKKKKAASEEDVL